MFPRFAEKAWGARAPSRAGDCGASPSRYSGSAELAMARCVRQKTLNVARFHSNWRLPWPDLHEYQGKEILAANGFKISPRTRRQHSR